jgi:hypothetical protein
VAGRPVAFFRFSWLPLILVMMAWIGHVALLKRLVTDEDAF